MKKKYYLDCSFLANKRSIASLSQLKLVDSKRLTRKIGIISISNFIKIKKAIKNLSNS